MLYKVLRAKCPIHYYIIYLRFFTILVENFDGSQRPIRRPERPKVMGGDGREAMGGNCYVYERWAICAKSLSIASKTEGGDAK
jgi:hypothetical protein